MFDEMELAVVAPLAVMAAVRLAWIAVDAHRARRRRDLWRLQQLEHVGQLELRRRDLSVRAHHAREHPWEQDGFSEWGIWN